MGASAWSYSLVMGRFPSAKEAADAVALVFQSYADRGIFRGFGVHGRGDLVEYRFLWHGDQPHLVRVDAGARRLTFRDLLPGIPYRSTMDRALRTFLIERSSSSLPEHRRIDPAKTEIKAFGRRGTVSIEARVLDGDFDYASAKLVKLVNEIFLGFLAGPYEGYMIEHFGAPEE